MSEGLYLAVSANALRTKAGGEGREIWAGVGEDFQGLHIGDDVPNLLYAEESLALLPRPPAHG